MTLTVDNDKREDGLRAALLPFECRNNAAPVLFEP
jgi:hypothetical protein